MAQQPVRSGRLISDNGWLAIMMAVAFTAIFGSMAAGGIADTNARRDIVVACYNAHQPNCAQLWNRR